MKIVIFAFLLFVGCPVLGQAEYHEANDYYLADKYMAAIPLFERAYKKKETFETARRLADCFWKTNNPLLAKRWYEKALLIDDNSPAVYLEYADVLKQLQIYEGAKLAYTNFALLERLTPDETIEITRFCDSFPKWNGQNLGRIYEIDNLNSKFSEIGPAWWGNRLVFASDRTDIKSDFKEINEITNASFYEMYAVDIENNQAGKIENITTLNNSPYHEGPATFSADGKYVVYSKTDYEKRRPVEKFPLDLYIAELENGVWVNRKPFQFNTKMYSETHPFLSKDGQRLYFSSDRTGGFGGSDLYVCFKNDDGEWDEPQNLGEIINTRFDEKFPTERFDNILYFSSNRPSSLGGLDIFRSILENESWSTPENLHSPINSNRDDMSLIFFPGRDEGLFTSNREFYEGSDDILGFSFQEEGLEKEPVVVYEGTRTMEVSGLTYDELYPELGISGQIITKIDGLHKAVDNVKIEYINNDTGKRDSLLSKNGEFSFPFPERATYTIQASKDGFFTTSATIDLKKGLQILGNADIVGNIEYDFNDDQPKATAYPLMIKIAEFMNSDKEVLIVISSYCDNRGDEEYNLKLSDRRAESVRKFLINQGISSSRIISMGLGESVPIIKNAQTEEEHQINRRTEFDLVKKSVDKLVKSP